MCLNDQASGNVDPFAASVWRFIAAGQAACGMGIFSLVRATCDRAAAGGRRARRALMQLMWLEVGALRVTLVPAPPRAAGVRGDAHFLCRGGVVI